jgi:hypothetical protein
MQTQGIDEAEFDNVMSRIFAHHLIPQELRLEIISLTGLEKCLECMLLFQFEDIHKCAVQGPHCLSCVKNMHVCDALGSRCLHCVTPHYCLSFPDDREFPSPENSFAYILSSSYMVDRTNLQYHYSSNRRQCTISGFVASDDQLMFMLETISIGGIRFEADITGLLIEFVDRNE